MTVVSRTHIGSSIRRVRIRQPRGSEPVVAYEHTYRELIVVEAGTGPDQGLPPSQPGLPEIGIPVFPGNELPEVPPVIDNNLPGIPGFGGGRPDHDLPGGGWVDNSLPGGGWVDNSLPGGGRPDQSLPGGGRVDNTLPGGGRVDNTLPGGRGQVDNTLPGSPSTKPTPKPPAGGTPDQGLPNPGMNPNPNPDVDVDLKPGKPVNPMEPGASTKPA